MKSFVASGILSNEQLTSIRSKMDAMIKMAVPNSGTLLLNPLMSEVKNAMEKKASGLSNVIFNKYGKRILTNYLRLEGDMAMSAINKGQPFRYYNPCQYRKEDRPKQVKELVKELIFHASIRTGISDLMPRHPALRFKDLDAKIDMVPLVTTAMKQTFAFDKNEFEAAAVRSRDKFNELPPNAQDKKRREWTMVMLRKEDKVYVRNTAGAVFDEDNAVPNKK